MHVISASQERTVTTPAAVMIGLAAPSRGSAELSTWRVRMNPGSPSPVHVVDREQVWMIIAGAFEFTVDGESAKAVAGQAVVVPAGASRRFHALAEAGDALVCMAAGGQVGAPGSEARQPIPWAV
ncbi:cupin domain-containing protein [Actinokineospora auranticolor]|uniref:Cupin domain-containing protein n=1 Tax=Actinokineospora auranticolor TaxID=155976 RepID=A0A2S6GEQ4_9PSEU|nr:cupin domain-containing protein [Actinokineospora auranticolor]PPK63709.1 Cupin domain-containing protein [Actinokineospora auranticolor]